MSCVAAAAPFLTVWQDPNSRIAILKILMVSSCLASAFVLRHVDVVICTRRNGQKCIANIGGCFVPLLTSSCWAVYSGAMYSLKSVCVCIICAIVAASQLSSPTRRGMVVNWIGVGVVAALASKLLTDGSGLRVVAVSFAAGSWGTFIGSDLIQLDKLKSSRVRFGGAGHRDGIVLCGVYAAVVAQCIL
jgi:uncharacterized membrane protein